MTAPYCPVYTTPFHFISNSTVVTLCNISRKQEWEETFFLSRLKTTIYRVILHCAIHSEKRHKVTGSSLWMALTNPINLNMQKTRNKTTKPRYNTHKRQQNNWAKADNWSKKIKVIQLLAVKKTREKYCSARNLVPTRETPLMLPIIKFSFSCFTSRTKDWFHSRIFMGCWMFQLKFKAWMQ